MGKSLDRRVSPEFVFRIIGLGLFIYLFFGFMLLPCLEHAHEHLQHHERRR